ncbi:MAG: hypothetical protein N3B13_02200 [Deltaproteobacteria bacterium]|nr:hypothetical protein [Deltaproteobacteria bacterium]
MKFLPYVFWALFVAVYMLNPVGCGTLDAEDAGTKSDAVTTSDTSTVSDTHVVSDTSTEEDSGTKGECEGKSDGTDCSKGLCMNNTCVKKCEYAGNLLDESGAEGGESCYPVGEDKYGCWECGGKDYLEACESMFDCGCNGVCLEPEGGSGFSCYIVCKDNSTCTDKYSLNAECVDTGLGYSVCVEIE